jgi:hypothetical protein
VTRKISAKRESGEHIDVLPVLLHASEVEVAQKDD